MIWSGVSAIVAALALLASVAIYKLTREAEDKRERLARMPVLVIFFEDDQIVVRNVGQGPALNVFLAKARSAIATNGYSWVLWAIMRHGSIRCTFDRLLLGQPLIPLSFRNTNCGLNALPDRSGCTLTSASPIPTLWVSTTP